MSFWQKFAFATAPTSNIDALLSALPASDSGTAASDQAGSNSAESKTAPGNDEEVQEETSPERAHSRDASAASRESSRSAGDRRAQQQAGESVYETTLDALLEAPDILSEIKAAANDRLLEFLAREDVTARLGGWVLWGLGGHGDEDVAELERGDSEEQQEARAHVQTGTTKERGMGNIARRREPVFMTDVDGDGSQATSSEEERKCANFPRLAAEILVSDKPNLASTMFDHQAVTTHPERCPSPEAFLVPFWETFLRSTPAQLDNFTTQVGLWARVNATLLVGGRAYETFEVLSTSVPSLLPRLLTLLPICSPINDIILLLLRLAPPKSEMVTTFVSTLLPRLNPAAPASKDDHMSAEELLRGVVGLGTLPPVAQSQGQAGFHSNGGQDNMSADREAERIAIKISGLTRELSSERMVASMLDWLVAAPNELQSMIDEAKQSRSPTEPRLGVAQIDFAPDELQTSSLVHVLAVLVDVIRKNNSDYVEQQMLAWARQRESRDGERELLDGSDSGSEHEDADDRGPRIVDLGGLLTAVAARLGKLQELVRRPRSFKGPMATSFGSTDPLTLERFRICEFYAELLHCSNMNLPNRIPSGLYDNEGFLAGGWRSADRLANVLTGSPSPQSESGRQAAHDHKQDDEASSEFSNDRAETASAPYDTAVSSAVDDDEGKDPFGDPSDEEDAREDLAERFQGLDIKEKQPEQAATASVASADEEPSTNPPVSPPATARVGAAQAPNEDDLPPGQLLKHMLLEHGVIETVLELFFAFPGNNFLHNVVYDILQQIFNGRIDRPLNRRLMLAVFQEGKLVQRILDGQKANDEAVAKPRGSRVGYMGHMTLIADDVVKLFSHYREEIYEVVQTSVPQPDWDRFVAGTLRETRERDITPLGGGNINAGGDTSLSGAISDDDDEFPMNSARTSKAIPAKQGGSGSPELSTNDSGAPSDQFSRYLANAISSDRADNFGSSDSSDDDEQAWVTGNSLDAGDIDLDEPREREPRQLGFEDRFETIGGTLRRSSSGSEDDGDDWGPFNETSATDTATDKELFDNEFKPTVSSAQRSSSRTASSNFEDDFDDDGFASTGTSSFAGAGGEDDFGDFEDASARVTLPSLESFGDFDFTEGGAGSAQTESSSGDTAQRPAFTSKATADDDGSSHFGTLSMTSPERPTPGPVQIPSASKLSPTSPHSGSEPRSPLSPWNTTQADLATSPEYPLGPAMHAASHLTDDGMIETISPIDGKPLRVPADEIALAHHARTSSSDGSDGMLSPTKAGSRSRSNSASTS